MACPHCPPSRRMPWILAFFIVSSVVVAVVACASGELPPRSANDPANPKAPETPPPALATSTAAFGSSATSEQSHVHGGNADAGSTLYTCPMHPEVVQASPGTCPKCGMQLRPKPGT